MPDFIHKIHIENFKSIRSCEIEDCKRINLFIGRPNVGKSNILEALSLFSIPYLVEGNRKLTSLVRVENESELFYNGSIENEAFIETDHSVCRLRFNPKEGLKAWGVFFGHRYFVSFGEKFYASGISRDSNFEPPVKKYVYRHNVAYRRAHAKYLIPPDGRNLLSIIENYPELKTQVVEMFSEYGLDIAFDKASQSIKIIQDQKDKGIFLIPYNSIADTLQRIIFYKSAIASNNNSILLFEEPEAHSFPPYMAHLTQEMIYKKDNQFFIATHSPFILNDLVENGRDELAVFIVYYEDRQTRLRQLSAGELYDVFQNGVDLFTNSESYV